MKSIAISFQRSCGIGRGWFVIFMNGWCSTWWFRSWFRWTSIRGLRETISESFGTLFSGRTARHGEVCFERGPNGWRCSAVEEGRRIGWCLIFNKEDEVCLLVGLVDPLANNEGPLSLNLSIGLILEQSTKVLYRDPRNRVNFAYLMSGK